MKRPKHLQIMDTLPIDWRRYIPRGLTKKQKIEKAKEAVKIYEDYQKKCEEMDIKEIIIEKTERKLK